MTMNVKSVKKKIDHKDLSVSVEADEPVDQWIDQGKLDTSSTVRQVRSLRTGSSSTKREDGSVTVSATFPDRESAELFVKQVETVTPGLKIKIR